jgi:hypothetical protein
MYGLLPSLRKNGDCPICLMPITGLARTSCGHYFCRSCIQHWVQGSHHKGCPVCREYPGADWQIDMDELCLQLTLLVLLLLGFFLSGFLIVAVEFMAQTIKKAV